MGSLSTKVIEPKPARPSCIATFDPTLPQPSTTSGCDVAAYGMPDVLASSSGDNACA